MMALLVALLLVVLPGRLTEAARKSKRTKNNHHTRGTTIHTPPKFSAYEYGEATLTATLTAAEFQLLEGAGIVEPAAQEHHGNHDASRLLALAKHAVDHLRFAESFALLKYGMKMATADDSRTLVSIGELLLTSGQVDAASFVLQKALQKRLGNDGNLPAELQTVALAGIAQASSWTGSTTANAKINSIRSAAETEPPPPFSWFLWATDTLKFQLKKDSVAVMVLQRGVLTAETLPLERPSVFRKVRWLLQRSSGHQLEVLEARLRSLPPPVVVVNSRPVHAATTAYDFLREADPTTDYVWRAGVPGEQLHRLEIPAITASEVQLDGPAGGSMRRSSRHLSSSPLVTVIDDFATPSECEALIAVGRPSLKRSTIAQSTASLVRTSSSAELLQMRLGEDSPVVRSILQRASQVLGIHQVRVAGDFEMQLVHYGEDEHYKLHYDAALDTQAEIPNDITRYATLFLYLSDVDVGGETVLPFTGEALAAAGCAGCEHKGGSTSCIQCTARAGEQVLKDCANPAIAAAGGVSVTPKQGRLIWWYNHHANGSFDARSMHAGCPVLLGEKWGLNIWLDKRDGQPLLTSSSHAEL